MIYVFTLFILIFLILFFDLNNKESDIVRIEAANDCVKPQRSNAPDFFFKTKKSDVRVLWYWLMFVWFTLVSGLAYNVGSDIVDYMNDYDEYAFFWRNHSFLDIFGNGNRQPGWVLLNAVCVNLCPNFLFLKMIIAIFVNFSIFSFIKKNTSFWFTGLFLFAVTLYLNLSFNALRQSLAVACFLWGYNYIIDKKYFKYLLWTFGAFMFHSSALICFALPFLYLLKINKWTLTIIGAALIFGTIYILKRGDIDQIAFDLFMQMDMGGDLGENITMLGERYTGEKAAKFGTLNILGIIMVLFNMGFILLVLLFNLKHNKRWPKLNGSVLIIYAMMVVLDYSIPILFFRFMFYFQILYFCSLADFFVMLPRRYFKQFRVVFTMTFLALFMVKPIDNLYSENEATGLPLLVQFYPYHSVIDHQLDPVRSAHFGFHR